MSIATVNTAEYTKYSVALGRTTVYYITEMFKSESLIYIEYTQLEIEKCLITY